ncbi:MAG: gephyrin-like molybdotransferase Glp, partial [Deltaproteobacteria bacterium]
MLPVDEALRRILESVSPTDSQRVSLSEAAHRVLAEDVRATLTQPPFDASAMDGYAVRAADVAHLPATLNLIGEARAGKGFDGAVTQGSCVRIFTGAPVPAGADAIVIQENTKSEGSSVTVVDGQPDPAHLRPRGGDFAEGQVLLPSGRRLDARAILLAAAMGHGTLAVRRRPVIAVLATGDELVEPGERPGPDQIVSSNPYGLAAMIAAAGGVPRLLGIARDTPAALDGKLDAAADADVLVTTGGASVGDHDLVGPVLTARGMTPGFWKIAMRPGKPLLFGRLGEQRVLGLPGNPVAALICGRVFLVPLIDRLL